MSEYIGINSEFINCMKSAIIKRNQELEKYDTPEQKYEFARYKDAYNKTDTVYEYKYTVEDFLSIGVEDREVILKILRNIRDMSRYLSEEQMDRLLIKKREECLKGYKETNQYVLTLMGCPIRERDYYYIGTHIDGIRDGIPIHEMTSTEINILINKGLLAKIIEENPNLEYLKFVSRRLSVYTIRTAEPFGLLYIDTSYSVGFRILEMYERIRLSYLYTIHNEFYATTYGFYETLASIYILASTVFTLLAERSMSILEFDFTSDDVLKSLYETFSIPYVSELPKSVRVAFAEKINKILMNKGNKQSIIDICDAFGVGQVFQYVLYKEYANAEVGYNPDLSLAENYNLSFIKVPIGESDIHKYMYIKGTKDGRYKIPYDEFVASDKRWGNGDDKLKNYVLEHDFSYMTTKYIGVDNVISLVDNALSKSEFMSILFANKKRLGDFKLRLSRPNIIVSLWEAFIYCVILISNKNGYEDTIVKDAEGLCYIYGIDLDVTLSKEDMEEYKKYLPKKLHPILDYKMVDDGMKISDFMDAVMYNRKMLTSLRALILNWTGDYYVVKHLIKLEDKISHMQINKYYGDMKEFDTYTDYLAHSNPEFYAYLESVRANPETEFSEMSEELISAIEDLQRYLNPSEDPDKADLIDFLSKMQEDEAETIKLTMFQMIAFLKSYTVDMRMTLTTYVLKDYTKILSETIAKYHIYEWSRLRLNDTIDVTISALKFHSYLTFYDQFREKSQFKNSNNNLPPWLCKPTDISYLRPDYSTYVKDTFSMTFYKSYEKDILTHFDNIPLIKYFVNESDVVLSTEETLTMVASKEYDNTYNYITSSLNIKYMNYEYDRVRNVDVCNKVSPYYFNESVRCIDTFRRVDNGRIQTDI